MRLFIALGVPADIGRELLQAAGPLLTPAARSGSRLRWTHPDNMHITLQFLGETSDVRRPELEQALGRIHMPDVHLRVGAPGVFARAGVLFASVQPTSSLLQLAGAIQAATAMIGWRREERSYSPHITLARSRQIPPFAPGALREWREREFTARCFHLYRSTTSPEGSWYEKLQTFPRVLPAHAPSTA